MCFHTRVGLQNKVIAGLAPAMLFCAGCTSTMPDRDVRMTRAYIYYLDGAGGAGVIRNWSRGVRKGFLDAGYDGAGEVFAGRHTWASQRINLQTCDTSVPRQPNSPPRSKSALAITPAYRSI